MPRYRRADVPGATYFFTVVTYRRRPILCDEPVRAALRAAVAAVRAKHPFMIDAWVLLPDHLHSTAWMQEVEQCRSNCRVCGPCRRAT
jgi:putative transposase